VIPSPCQDELDRRIKVFLGGNHFGMSLTINLPA